MKKLFTLFLVICSIFIVFLGCQDQGRINHDQKPENNPYHPIFSEVQAEKMIGKEGGIIEVEERIGSPIAGTKIEIANGTFSENTTVAIYYALDNPTIPDGANQASKVILLTMKNEQREENVYPQKSMEVTISYTPTRQDSALAAFYIHENDTSYDYVGALKIDREENKIVFLTKHASAFVVLEDANMVNEYMDKLYSTGFIPNQDGFRIQNEGSDIPGHQNGECAGMACFSGWYFKTHRYEGSLYNRFLEEINWGTGKTTVQKVITVRSYTSVIKEWSRTSDIVGNKLLLSNQDAALQLCLGLKYDGPQYVYLANEGTDAHAVIAYAWNRGKVMFYDVNKPGQPIHATTFDTNNGFSNYTTDYGYTWTKFAFLGISQSYARENLESIYKDAKEKFGGSTDLDIKVTSHTDGQTVSTSNLLVQGQINGGISAIDKFLVYINGEEHIIDFDTTKNITRVFFQKQLTLKQGENRLLFVARPIDTYSTAKQLHMVLKNESPKTNIYVTMTWDENNTDVDLYVTDPLGNTSWFANMKTPDGAELDYDNTIGYGPEHWTLASLLGHTLREGNYIVKVHYYHNHNSQTTPIIWNTKIILNEGIHSEISRSFDGVIGVDNASNAVPGNSGTDWDNVAVVKMQSINNEWVASFIDNKLAKDTDKKNGRQSNTIPKKIVNLGKAIKIYKEENGFFPLVLGDILENQKCKNYLDLLSPFIDSWGNMLRYEVNELCCKVISLGANGTYDLGNGDDIVFFIIK